MSYRLPPLNGLRAFEASARHLSFTRAADELCVTAGAVSQQVKALEAALGIKLFRRLRRGIVLTAVGEGYLPAISAAFKAISIATEAAAPSLRSRKFRLGIASSILAADSAAVRSLKADRHAGLFVHVRRSDDMADLIEGRLDALLRATDTPHPGLHAQGIVLRATKSGRMRTVLVTHPGLAGCREHRRLVKLLRA
ncbi:MAG: LysR family transcriptional regulator [Candidatus Eiseniibacteriota bacterium]